MSVPFGDAHAASGRQSSRPTVPSFDGVRHSRSLAPPRRPTMSEIWRINPPVRSFRVFETGGFRAELLTFAKCNFAELEFSIPLYLVVLLPDGAITGGHWSAGPEAGRLPVGKADTIIFNPAREYIRIEVAIPRDGCRTLIVAIQPSMLTRLSDAGGDLATTSLERQIGLDDQGVRQALLAIQEEIETPGLNSAVYVDALLTLLLTRLIRCAANSPRPHRPAKGGLPNWRLKRALELLEGDVAPSLVELGQLLRIRPTSFCRAFKQSTGISPHRYLLTHRVNRAKEMMKHQGRNLTQIALECGFSSSSQFSVVFKKMVGVRPSDYRRSL